MEDALMENFRVFPADFARSVEPVDLRAARLEVFPGNIHGENIDA